LPWYLKKRGFLDHSKIKLFADDIKAYAIINTLRDAVNFQMALNCISEWCSIWQLNINGSKSCVMHIGRTNLHCNYHIQSVQIPVSDEDEFLTLEYLPIRI